MRAAGATALAVPRALLPGKHLHTWGATPDEVARRYRSDEVLPDPDVRFVRAITIDAPASAVWPWVAQIGRGAGYYSYDVLDNGRRPSADHVLDIPPARVGDRNTDIGEVVVAEPEHDYVVLAKGARFLGSETVFLLGYTLQPVGNEQTRVIAVIMGCAKGRTAGLVNRVFALMDYVMASEQLRGMKRRIETPTPVHHVGCRGAADHQRAPVEYAAGPTT